MSDRVLVTGISGFLGGHLALALLKSGYTVRGSVRNLDRAAAVRETLAAAGGDVTRLEFVALDLLSDSGWDEAMSGVRYLQHTASPFVLETPKDPQELIRPAVEGTRRALGAALRTNVEHIVLTSSIAAIQYGHKSYERLLTEADWTRQDAPSTGAYPASKTLAERMAWQMVESAGRRNTLSVINPAGIFAPLLDSDPGTSRRSTPLHGLCRRARCGGLACRGDDRSGLFRPALHRRRGCLCDVRGGRHAASGLPEPSGAHRHPAQLDRASSGPL